MAPLTELEWRTNRDPMTLFRHLYSIRKRSKRGQRRPRRLAVEFWRWQAGNLRPLDRDRLIEAVYLAEQWADTGIKPDIPGHLQRYFVLGARSWSVARDTIEASINSGNEKYQQAQDWKLFLLREIFGNPFHSVTIDPVWLTWNDGTVIRLAQGIYETCEFTTLPILGDALEEAGCDDPVILEHCRANSQHVRGCWVIDQLLGLD